MRIPGRAVLYGFFLWLLPFVVSVSIFPLKSRWPAVFESLMPVVVAGCTMAFACRYLGRAPALARGEGLRLGLLWAGMSWGLDLPLFLGGPMRMSLASYAADIGLVYLMIPLITAGAGRLRLTAQ